MQEANNADAAISGWREKAVYAILFSLPVGGAIVPHWLGICFSALVILGLPELFRRHRGLSREEHVLVGILVAYFVVFVVTALANGWGERQTRSVGTEIRFLLAPAVLLLLRRTPEAGIWLLRGGVAGGFAVCLHALLDVYVLDMDRAWGLRGPLVLGPYAALLAMFSLVFWHMAPNRPALRVLIGASAAGAVAALILSNARGGFVGLVGMVLVWTVGRFRGRRLAAAAAVSVAVLVAAYVVLDQTRERIHATWIQNRGVTHSDDRADISRPLNPVAARLEMWRVSIMIIRDNPVWGVGRGNYVRAAQKYVDQGKVHWEVVKNSQPHNAYLEAVVSKGIPGLVVLLALLLYPLSFFVRGLRRSPDTALLGTLLVVGIALFSLTETTAFLRNSFIAIFLIYLCTFFTMHRWKLSRGEA
jgi:O-antigen ligase